MVFWGNDASLILIVIKKKHNATIADTKSGKGSTAGWGKLKSGAGWISLDYATKL
jgi:hypothetical protein